MTKLSRLNALKAKLLQDNPCSNLASSANQLVFGSGSPDANIVFVGEAPGKKEDQAGEPFVGASGRVLDELLGSIGLERDDVYITNIVKYRPPDNRDPSLEEKQEFWPYLMEQISIIEPKVVASLGRHSGQVFKPDLHISADHGQPQRTSVVLGNQAETGTEHDNELSFIHLPLYHPAAAMYNGSLRKTLKEDFRNITKLLQEN